MGQLHPVLQRYFATIPEGSTGIGEGVFDTFGTDHRWLWPVLALLERWHVIIPGRHHRVPFRVENRTEEGRQTARRFLHLNPEPWCMVDAVSTSSGRGIVDVLGGPAVVEAHFDLKVDDGRLQMTSRRIVLRIGPARVPVPKAIRPVIRLCERFDDDSGLQHVALTVDAPILGRLYDYSGSFTYRIEGEAPAA